MSSAALSVSSISVSPDAPRSAVALRAVTKGYRTFRANYGGSSAQSGLQQGSAVRAASARSSVSEAIDQYGHLRSNRQRLHGKFDNPKVLGTQARYQRFLSYGESEQYQVRLKRLRDALRKQND
ncbi:MULTISPECIES: hypothetical protein [Paraburkholderia]|uniref:Uncharacterized protein n=1 Tax=Paraburkholderia madseniana TaxID=2599607 RepID=A0A6N6W0A8_9BURK|nr:MULTISPECIES: hypothetical protein [Paraburkholderia]KAE8753579.1 hypothetical protein FSO04_44405 [Paraburkholderia madseniana]MCX4145090.1 hypothetical protein [Paraburkholderia madseniana]MDN7148041.1 hypothetical protein [Paraburkholderia sp. WS6]MDQ6406921.1 hypothetical protein [Paraburkholderia madseniana]